MARKKVLVGMSGGVDSAVTAALLLAQGYEVTGVFVEAYNEPGCRTDQDKKDALQVALKLGIPFQVLDLRKEYKEKVVQYFLDEYKAGRTPNPDIVCNREVKFGLLYDYMLAQGFDYLATGHYSRVTEITRPQAPKAKQWQLQRPVDQSKDQTYFLWEVASEKLARVLLPLGELKKSEVRAKARELQLPNAAKPDSMGVCMIGELNMGEFLKEKLGTKPGPIIWQGQEVGRHEGLWFYTIGSRGGFLINPKWQSASMPPLYVIRKDASLNILEVGEREECFSDQFVITNSQILKYEGALRVRVRNLGELYLVKSLMAKGESWEVKTEQPVFAIAPGQSAVLYDTEGGVVGGGIIAGH